MKAAELREALDDLGLPQSQLARELGVSRRLVVYWLAGERTIHADAVRLVRMAVRRGYWIPQRKDGAARLGREGV